MIQLYLAYRIEGQPMNLGYSKRRWDALNDVETTIVPSCLEQ
jgi:hypothetical protein